VKHDYGSIFCQLWSSDEKMEICRAQYGPEQPVMNDNTTSEMTLLKCAHQTQIQALQAELQYLAPKIRSSPAASSHVKSSTGTIAEFAANVAFYTITATYTLLIFDPK
jgi:hypothetical protein